MPDSKLRRTQIEVPDSVIHLGIGQPRPEDLPLGLMRQASEHCLARGDALMLNYGPERGDGDFLESLARFLTAQYQVPVQPTRLMTTGGVSQALEMVGRALARPGDTILVEEPTYFLAHGIFAEQGLNVVGIPVDDGGMKIDVLAQAVEQFRPSLVYTIPVFQNPAGVTLNRKRRTDLLGLSRDYGFTILADEVYQLLNYTVQPPPPLACLDGSERVISLGSFSKIWAPGMRLGWIQATPPVIDRLAGLGFLASGGAINQYVSHVLRSAMELGLLEQHLENLKQTYRARIGQLTQAIEAQLGQFVDFRPTQGGYFLWLRMKDGTDTEAWQPRAKDFGVSFQPGRRFSSRGGLSDYMRICFARYEADKLVQGIERLAAAIAAG